MKSDRTSQKISYSTANRRGKKIQAIFRASKALGRPKKTFKAFWMARIPMAGAKFFLDQKTLLDFSQESVTIIISKVQSCYYKKDTEGQFKFFETI